MQYYHLKSYFRLFAFFGGEFQFYPFIFSLAGSGGRYKINTGGGGKCSAISSVYNSVTNCDDLNKNKKLSCHREAARRSVLKILPSVEVIQIYTID